MKNDYIYNFLYRAVCTMSFLIIVTNIVNGQPCTNPPTANAGSNTSICAGQNYTLSGSIGGGANTATWSTSGTGTFNPNGVFGTATTYTPSAGDITAGSVSITLTTDDPDGAADCIPAVSSFTLTINALPSAPVITPSGATTFCLGSSVDLTSSYVTGNVWSPGGATTQMITVSTSGSYSVTYTDINNCSATSAPTVITVNGSASITPSGPTTFCAGGSVTLTANSSASYSWAPGSETTQAIVVTTSGTYTVTTTDANSCTATASQTVTVNDVPTASISGTSVLCTGMTNTLTATATAGSGTITNYQWVLNGSTNVGTNSSTYGATAVGSYTVRVTNSNNCTFTSTAFVLSGSGPLNGTYTIGAGPASCSNYVSFASAFSDLNTKGVSGNVTFNIAANYTELVTSPGLVLKQCALAVGLRSGPSQTISFIKTGVGANPVLTAFTPGIGTYDGIVKIVGVDNVTFNGIDVIENAANTTGTMQMEMGYGVFKCDVTDGAVGVTITNCNITLNKANTNAIGVRVANSNETVVTSLTGTIGADQASTWAARNRVNITNNVIANTYGAVLLNANAGSGPANDSANVVTGNTISNFGGLSTAFTMISASDNRYFSIANNNINGGASTTGAMNGINGGSGPYGAINGNTVTLVSASMTAGTIIGIQYGASGANNNGSITNNIVQNCAATSSATIAFTGITSGLTGAGASIIVNGNTVQNNSIPGTGTFTGIANSNSPTNLDMSNNIVTGNSKTNTGTGSIAMNLISQGAPTNSTINNNTITNNTVSGGNATVALGCIVGGISIYTMNGNIISNNTVTGMTGTAVATITGIINGGLATNETITNNAIRKLFITGTSTGSHQIRGIVNSTATTAIRTVRGNTIDSLYANSSSSAVISGIVSNACATSSISKNKIFDLYPGQSTTASAAKGISVIGGTTHNVFNNIIGIDVSAAGVLLTGSSSVIGIEVTGATNVNMYFNTIRLAGTGSGTAFGSSGIHLTVTTANCDIRNNIVINLTNAGGLGAANSAVALRRSATAITGYNSNSNNNIYYAGTPGTNHLIYYDGTNTYQTIGALIGGTGIAPRESVSKTEAVSFQSIASGNVNFLKVNASPATFVEGGAQTITSPAITDDYFGTTRSSTPDIGAHEGNFQAITPSLSSISASPSTGQCSAVIHTITAVVNPGQAAVTSVILNYSYGVTAQTPITMSNGGSGNTYTGQIPAATPTNANVTWSVTVNDGTYSVTGNGTAYKDDYLLGTSFTASASPSQVCLGTSTTLSVAAPAIITIGAGATTSATYPNPFYSAWSNTHNQYLITASELLAAGLYAGNITSLAITITSGTTQLSDVSLKMGHTNATIMSAFVSPAFTTVYSAATLAPVIGVNTITFSTPFNWDGVSNIVIEFCWGNSSTATVSSTALADNTSYVSTIHTNKSASSTGAAQCVDFTTGLTTYSVRPQFKINGLSLISGFTYTWSATPGGNGLNSTSGPIVTATPTVAGVYTYSVVATDANGCTAVTSPVSVTALPVPTAPTATNTSQCGYGTPTVSVVGSSGGIFRWYLNGSGGSPLAGQQGNMLSNYPINTTTTFYVSEYDGSCEGPRSPVIATVTNPDAVTAGSSSSVTCPFTNVDLTATQTGSTNFYTYTWTASPASGSGIPVSASGSPVTIQATISGTYTYTVVATDASLSCATTSSVVVTYSPAPTIVVTPASSTICPNTPVQLLANQTGNAYNFNGTNQYIAVGPSNSIDLFTGSAFGSSFTLEAWVSETAYPTASPGDAGIFSHYQSASGAGYFLRTSEATTPTPAYSGLGAGGGAAVVSANGTMPLNTWTHLAAIFKYNSSTANDSVKIYKNGVLLVKGVAVIGHSPDSLRIGSDFGARYFNGKFDEMRIWNVALDTVTLNTWMTQPITSNHPNFANLVLYYNFDAISSTTIADLSGNGNTGYLRNGPTQIVSGAAISNVTYSWSPTIGLSDPAISNPIATAGSTTTYTATATSPNSCFATATSVINVIPNPPAPIAANNSQCGFGIPTASVTGTGGTFKWYLASTGGTALAGETANHLTTYSISTTTTFYVSEVSGGLCEGPRAAVVQTVTNPDAISASASSPTCFGDVITLTATQTGTNGNAYTFTWNGSPSSGSGISSPTTGISIPVTPTAVGTYTYTVNASDGSCVQVSSVVVTVSDLPSITSAAASPNPVCAGNTVTLTALSNTIASAYVVVGTGTVQNTASTTTNMPPYGNYYSGTRQQMLILASDLTASGMYAGAINSLGFDVVSNTNALGYQNFTIALKNTAVTALTTTFVTGATPVYTISNFNPTPGWTNHVFPTPFVWDGVSNILVETYFSNCGITGGSSCSGTACTGYGSGTTYTQNAITRQTTKGYVCHTIYYSDATSCNPQSQATALITNSVLPNMRLNAQTITLGSGNYTWTWNPGAINGNIVTVTPNTTTTYTVTATNTSSGCTSSQNVVVNVNPVPATPLGQDDAQCGPGIPTCYVSGTGSGLYRWYLSPTGGTPIPGETSANLVSYSINNTTTFYVTEYDGTCESSRVPIVQSVSIPGPITASATSPACLGSVVNLTLSNPTSYSYFIHDWTANPQVGSGLNGATSGDPGDGHLDVTPTAAGTYTYTVVASDGLCNANASVVVTVSNVPGVTVTPTTTTICPNVPVQLTASQANGAGTSVLLNGTNQYLAIPHSSSLAFSVGAGSKFTIEAWIRPTTFSQFGGILSKYQVTGQPGYFLRENTAAPYTGIDAGGSGTVSTATGLLVANTWYHVAAVFFPKDATNDSVRIYINGALVKLGVTLMPVNTDSVKIGSDFSSRFFNGQIDEVRIWNDSLTSSTISSWRTRSVSNTHPNFANLVAYYNFDIPSTTVVNDLSGNGNTAYVRNSPSFVTSGATISNVTFSWSPTAGLTNSTISNPVATTPTSTTYTVTVTEPGGCTSSASSQINVSPTVAAPTGTNGTVCGIGIPNCSAVATGGGLLRWYLVPIGGSPIPGENGSTLTTYSISATTTFYVTEFDGTCESLRTPVIATQNNPDPVTATANPNPICGNSPLTLNAVQNGITNTYSYSWTASPVSGSGMTGIQLGPLTNLYSNDFSTGLVGNDAISGTSLFTGGELELTNNTLSQLGAFSVLNPGAVSPAYLAVSFNLTVTPAGGADGFSYSFGDDVSATSTTPSFETGTGTKFKLSFDAYTNGANTNGIYLMYNTTAVSPAPTDAGVIAYSSNVSWRGATGTAVSLIIDELGRVTLTVGANTIFSNVQLPNAYTVANKSSWFHIFKARTGGVSELHHMDNVLIQYKLGLSSPTVGQNVVITPTAGGTYVYTVLATDAGSNCATTSSVTVNVTSPPVISNISATPSTICLGQSSMLAATASAGSYTWTWNPGNLSGNTQTVTPSVSTTYTVVATDPVTNCTTSGTVTVDVLNSALQPIIVANPSSICGTGTSALSISNAQSGVTYTWESSPTGLAGSWTVIGTGAAITTGTLTQDTYYQVSATCGASTTTSSTQLVSVVNPHITSFTGATRCGVGQVTLSVTGTGSFDWFTNSSGGTALAVNTSTYSPIIGAPTSYWVQAYTGTCIDPAGRQLVTAFMNPAPAVNVSSNHGSTMCNNQSLTLTATSGNDPNYSYSWSTNGGATIIATGNILNANPAATTTYYLLAQDNSGGANAGCANAVNTIVTVNPAPPIPVVLPANPAVCSTGGCIDLTVQGATVSTQQNVIIGTGTVQNGTTAYPAPYGNYWTGDRNQNLILASELIAAGVVAGPINSIGFSVATVNAPALGTFKNFTISIKGTSTASLTTTYVTGLTLVYTNNSYLPVVGWNQHVFNAGTFNWNGVDNIVIETTFMQCTTCPGTACTSFSSNCIMNQTTTSFNSTIDTHGDASCAITTAATGTTYLQRPNIMLNALTGSPISYTWNPGSLTGPTVNVCPTATTTYTVTASLANTCTSSATTVVTYDPIVTPTITPSLTNICPGTSTTLNANSGYSNYSWSDGSGIVGTTALINVSPAVTTTYTLTVNNNGACSATASVVITVANLIPPTVIAVNNDPTTFCAGGSVTLDAGSPYDSYSWSNGSALGALQTQVASTSGTYVVTVTRNGCTATSSGTVVTVNPNPPTALIAPAGPINLCSNGSNSPVTLTADITGAGGGATIVWNQDGNPSTSSINVSAGDIDLLLNGNVFGYYFQVTNSQGCSSISNTVTVNEVPCGGPTLYAKLFLEGYYSGPGSNIMDNVVIPPTGGLLYHSGLSSDVEDVDFVTLSAMNENSPYGLIESQTGILKRNGTIQVTFSGAVSSSGQYYIKVTHRNALETWSALPVVIGATTSSSRYDFTTAASKAYGNYQSDLLDGNWGIYSGDISDAATATIGLQDGLIESQDYGDMENAVYATLTGYVTEDITGDGIVESADYGLMENNVYFTRVLHRP